MLNTKHSSRQAPVCNVLLHFPLPCETLTPEFNTLWACALSLPRRKRLAFFGQRRVCDRLVPSASVGGKACIHVPHRVEIGLRINRSNDRGETM